MTHEAREPAEQTWAVVPIKDLKGGKQRLASLLSTEHRKGLITAMARDVLAALAECQDIDQVLIVSSDPAVELFARDENACFFLDETGQSLSEAITNAARMLCTKGIGTMLSIHADVPLVSPVSLSEFLLKHTPSPSLSIAPSNDEDGSNLMLCSPPNIIAFHYGKASFAAHVQAAADVEIKVNVFKDLTLGLDIDRPEDLKSFIDRSASINRASNTKRFLTSSGIAARLSTIERNA